MQAGVLIAETWASFVNLPDEDEMAVAADAPVKRWIWPRQFQFRNRVGDAASTVKFAPVTAQISGNAVVRHRPKATGYPQKPSPELKRPLT